MTMHKALYPRDDVDRLYVPRKKGGRGTTGIEDSFDTSIQERGLITTIRNNTDKTIDNRMTKSRKQKWEGKPLHGRFKRLINNISHVKTETWLRKGNFKRETESPNGSTKQCHMNLWRGMLLREGRGGRFSYPSVSKSKGTKTAVKRRYEWKSIPRTLWPAACWTKKGFQVTWVSWPDSIVGEGKSLMIGPFFCHFFIWGIWKRIFSSGQKSALERRTNIQPNSGRTLASKKTEKNLNI